MTQYKGLGSLTGFLVYCDNVLLCLLLFYNCCHITVKKHCSRLSNTLFKILRVVFFVMHYYFLHLISDYVTLKVDRQKLRSMVFLAYAMT